MLVFALLLGCSAVQRQRVLEDPTLGGFVREGSVSVLWVREGRSRTMEEYSGQHYGRALTAIGDVNADGVHEVVSCSELAATHDGRRWASRVSALSGRDGSELWTWRGPVWEFVRDLSVVGVGDLDGDAIEDLAVTANGWRGPVSELVLSGRDGHDLRPDEVQEQEIASIARDNTAMPALDVPDVDGDESADRLLGELVDAGQFACKRGRAKLISGTTGAVVRSFEEPPYEPALLPSGTDWYRAGTELRLLWGDVDGDGRGDVVLVVTCYFGPWTITAFSGADGRRLLYASTTVPYPVAHWTGPVVLPGDLDGDGRDDLVMVLDLPGARSSIVAVGIETPAAR